MLPITIIKYLKLKSLLFLVLAIGFCNVAKAQLSSSCPLNIDFELGSFQNWQCYQGIASTVGTTNVITVNPTPPIPGLHTIITKGTLIDPYAKFNISPPGGSAYSVKLGNDGLNSQAERISYLFTVPQNQTDFVITYQYAVVLQDPGHLASQQPRFTAKVFDITANSYIACGSFDYAATSALPGFAKSPNNAADQVIYKSWTPVSINLNGYQGHQLQLEFTAADCTLGGHFGYAYVDVNSVCSSLITGNYFCPSNPTFTLTGPAGFATYNWYTADRSKLLGTGINLTLPTANADNTSFSLDLIPFAGFGCNYTVGTTVHALPIISFQITDPAPACVPSTTDITTAAITASSDSDLVYTYWKDAAASVALPSPNALTSGGTFYIQATNPAGCVEIKPVNVVINQLPVLQITNPPTVCLQTPVDLTANVITAGSSQAVTYTYWQDTAATKPLINAANITTAGTYYVKATNTAGCAVIKPVIVNFFALPIVTITNPDRVCFPSTIDITTPAITNGSDPNLTFTYWTDSLATNPLSTPDKVSAIGIYYIKGTNTNGCVTIKPVVVIINPLPDLVINTPPDLCFPDKADITLASVTSGSANPGQLSYWTDANATIPLLQPNLIGVDGTYYIKATSIYGCEIVKPVKVTIHQLPILVINDPAKTYIPGTIDLTAAAIVKGSSANLTFTYWNDASATNAIFDPTAISKTGVFYIKATNIYGCFVIKAVNVMVSTIPNILVPKAFTPDKIQNNTLYPFLVGIKTFKGFRIYDRWGILVFQTDSPNPENGWNGIYKGQIKFLDTYTWYAEGYDYFGNLVHKTGSTVLLK